MKALINFNNDDRLLKNTIYEHYVGWQSEMYLLFEKIKEDTTLFVELDVETKSIIQVKFASEIDESQYYEISPSEFIDLFKRKKISS